MADRDGTGRVSDVVDPPIFVTAAARPYLEIQQGSIWNQRGTPEWDVIYRKRLYELYESMVQFLPPMCDAMIDIGGGLSGIGIILRRHYAAWDQPAALSIVDGVECEPVMTRHREPFSNAGVAKSFHLINGSEIASYHGPHEAHHIAGKFDLVVSFGAWCFHIEPGVYLPFVRRALKAGGRLILEVRRDRPQWRTQLDVAFGGPIALLHQAPKFERLVYVAQ